MFSRRAAHALIATRCASMPDPIPATSHTIGQILTVMAKTPDALGLVDIACTSGGRTDYTPAALDVAVKILQNALVARIADGEYAYDLAEHRTKLREGNLEGAANFLRRAAASLEKSSRHPAKPTPSLIIGLSRTMHQKHWEYRDQMTDDDDGFID